MLVHDIVSVSDDQVSVCEEVQVDAGNMVFPGVTVERISARRHWGYFAVRQLILTIAVARSRLLLRSLNMYARDDNEEGHIAIGE